MRLIKASALIGVFFLSACQRTSHSSQGEPKLAKTIPPVYLSATDLRLQLLRDTMFLDRAYYTGFIIGKYSSGDTAFVRGYFNGVSEGRQSVWSEEHVLIENSFYINGKKEGLQQSWWSDGKPQLRFQTDNDLYQGEFLEWNREGLLIKQFNYEKGQEVGSQRLWWDNGTVRANYVIRNGRKYGLIGLKLCANPNDSTR